MPVVSADVDAGLGATTDVRTIGASSIDVRDDQVARLSDEGL